MSADPPQPPSDPGPGPRSVAVRVVSVAVAIGVVVQYLFVDVGWGINYPITIGAVLLVGWLLRDPAASAPRLADAWLPAAAVFFAAFVAVRGDTTLAVLDALGSLALTVAALATFGGYRVVERTVEGVLRLTGEAVAAAMVGIGRPLAEVGRRWPERRTFDRAGPLARGLLLAVPLVIVFTVLFAAADAVFARVTEDLFAWEVDWGELIDRLLVAVVAGWVVGGLLAWVALRGSAPAVEPGPGWAGRPRIGPTESVIALSALNLLFAAFVVIQATYLFGGLDTLAASGLTYAEYARRGFFELLAVAFLVAFLILAFESFVARRTPAYLASAVVLVALTIVILASSLLRLRLYQDAYGWTELRFYVLAAIVWLAIGAAGAIVTLLTNRSRWLLHGMAVLSVVFGIAFNLIGPVRFIAEQNVARAIDPSLVPADGETGLDAWYLAWLGADADIVLAESLPELPPREQAEVRAVLHVAAIDLATDLGGQAWQAWNASRERLRALLR